MNDHPISVKDKKILVTGASSGIGEETAIVLARLGAKLIIAGRDEERLNNVFKKLDGSDHKAVVGDLSKTEEIDKLIKECGALDGLVNSAGKDYNRPIKFLSKKNIDEVFDINYTAPVLLVNNLFKEQKIKQGASLVFISSISSMISYKGGTLYCGSKAGIDAFSRAIALEFAVKKIRSNTINAAIVRTPLLDRVSKILKPEQLELMQRRQPLGFGDPNDVANMALFLLSDASKWITGTAMVMDGGLTAY